ncbi:MAG: cupin domain-containing protein [Bacteroidota bacterium]|nr:cupin domain-containing protein [Bacteroidota bacterium]
MEQAFILKPNEGRLSKPYNVLGMPVHLKVSSSDTGGQMSIFVAEYKRNEGPPLHLHDNDEAFFIIEGEFIFQAGDKRFTGVAGDTVFIPRNTPHTTLTVSETGKMLFTVNPTGNVEKIFEKLDSYKEMPSIEEIVRVHEELGLKIVGPPLQL